MSTTEETLSRMQSLMLEQAKVTAQRHKYEHENRIEFFGIANEKKAREHDDCCKLFRGANPKQKELLEAWDNPGYKVFTYSGANRCLGHETLIFDPVKNEEIPVGDIKSSFHVLAFDGIGIAIAEAEAPFIKEDKEPIYKIVLSHGGWFTASKGHLVLTPCGYRAISELHQGCAVFLPSSILESDLLTHGEDAQSSLKKAQGSQCGCLVCSRSCDGQFPQGKEIYQYVSPLQVDAHEHIFFGHQSHEDEWGNKSKHSRLYQDTYRRSTLDAQNRSVVPVAAYEHGSSGRLSTQFDVDNQVHGRSTEGFFYQPQPIGGFAQQATRSSYTCCNDGLLVPLDVPSYPIVTSIEYLRDDVKYDFTVPKYHNYVAGGAIHHNTGKTTIGTVIGLSVLYGRWPWSNKDIRFAHGHPRKVRYVGQDWEKHIKAVVEAELHKWWPKNRVVKTKKNNFGVDSLWIDEKTGSTLEIMSNNQDPDLHEGWNGDLIIYDEPPRREIRVANARGLVDRCGRELFTMTLLKEAWVDREVIKARNEDGTPDTSVYNIHSDILVNVGYGITIEGVEQFKKTLRADEVDARIKGVPSYMSGLIYAAFDRGIHLKSFKKIPLDWIVDISIDFHPSKPWAVLFMATDRRGFKYVIDEIWEKGSWKAIGEEIVRRIKQHQLRVKTIIIDPLSKGDENSDLNEESVYEKMGMLFMTYGHPLFTASKDKEGGIHMTQDLLMTENEMPALFFSDKLKRTILEIEGYMRDPDTGKPSKEDDDMMENLYRLVLLDTRWEELEDEEEPKKTGAKRNPVTGY